MPNYDYDFRVLIDTTSGDKKSYGTSSFVSADGAQPILSSSQVLDRINSLKEIEYYNAKTYTTSSLDALFASKSLFTFSDTDGGSDYQFLSASIRGNPISGSITFTGNSTPSGSINDFIKRYKFYGNKVCNVLGIPENYWIYVDKFRFTNTGSEQNYLSGDILGQSLHLTHNLSIANQGAVETDLPFQHARDTDRWLKWRNVSGSVPHNELQIGYSNLNDRYEIRTSDGENDLTGTGVYGTLPLIISASKLEVADAYGGGGDITASGGIRVNKSAHIAGNSNLTIDGLSTSYTNNTIHQLQFNHSTKPSGINFSSLGGGKIDFRVAVDESPTTLMVLSGSDEGTATLKLTGDITASGDVFATDVIIGAPGTTKATIPSSGTDIELTVAGDISASGILYLGNHDVLSAAATNTNIITDNDIYFKSGSTTAVVIDGSRKSMMVGSNNFLPPETLTVEGNISASGAVYVDDVQVKDEYRINAVKIADYTGQINFGNDSQKVNIDGTSIKLDAPVTASIISASGFVFDETRDKTAEIDTSESDVWKTIAICKTTGAERATATFVLTEEDSGHHSAYTFNATTHFGKSAITVYNGGYYGSDGPFDGLKILTGGTYDGAILQVHIASDASLSLPISSMQVHMYHNSHDDTGWELEPFTDVVDAGNGDLTTNNCEVNLRVNESQETDQNQQGFISTAGAAFQGDVSSSGQFLGYIPNSYQFQGTSLASGNNYENIHFEFNSMDTDAGEDNATSVRTRIIAAYDGYVAKAVVKSKNAAGSSDFRLFKVGSGTNPDLVDDGDTNDNDSNDAGSYTYQLGSTRTVDFDSGDLSKTVTFGTGYTFSEGDILSISVLLDNDDSNGEWNGVLVLMYNVT